MFALCKKVSQWPGNNCTPCRNGLRTDVITRVARTTRGKLGRQHRKCKLRASRARESVLRRIFQHTWRWPRRGRPKDIAMILLQNHHTMVQKEIEIDKDSLRVVSVALCGMIKSGWDYIFLLGLLLTVHERSLCSLMPCLVIPFFLRMVGLLQLWLKSSLICSIRASIHRVALSHT